MAGMVQFRCGAFSKSDEAPHEHGRKTEEVMTNRLDRVARFAMVLSAVDDHFGKRRIT